MRTFLPILLFALALLSPQLSRADLAAIYNSPTDVPVTASNFTAGGTFSATLNFAPVAGTSLTVVNNTGAAFINGTFSNLAHGQFVTLRYGKINYRFVANYYGGTGNDLVLQWAKTRAVAWGDNHNGQIGDKTETDRLVPTDVLSDGVLAGKTVIALSAGETHSLALCSDGTVAAWGRNSYGQLGASTSQPGVPVAVDTSGVLAGKTVVAVSAGYRHSLALCSDGTVAAWGSNSDGCLGDGTTTGRLVPVLVNREGVLSGKTVVSVSAGQYHSAALCSDGTVVTWGYNLSGQLGNNSTASSPVPVAVNTEGVLAGKTVIAVTAGFARTIALCSDGVVATWGWSFSGVFHTVPVAVSSTGVLSGKSVVAVSAGATHSLVLCSDGTVASWGSNDYGQLGNDSRVQSLEPVVVSTAGVLADKMVVGVAAGQYHSLAQCSDGTVVAWGINNDGQFGNNSTQWSPIPVAVSSIPLASGEHYTSAVTGATASHNLALIASPSSPVAARLAATNVTKTGAVLNGTVDPDGTPATAYFEYGVGVSYGSIAIATLSSADGFGAQKVSANLTGLTPGTIYRYRLTVVTAAHTVITTDGSFATSTDVAANFSSASDVPVTTELFTAAGSIVDLTLNFTPPVGTSLMVVKSTGAEFINGQFSNLAHGQLVILSYGGMNYRFIANYYGGTGNDLVLMWAKTRPVAWGNNSYGQLGDNRTTNQSVPVDVHLTGVLAGKTIVSMAAGGSHSLALCSDGTLAAWGRNFYGQLGNNSHSNSSVPVAVATEGVLSGKTVVAIAAGENRSFAICSDGTVAAWGHNADGQLGNNSRSDSAVPVMVNSTGVLSGKAVVAIAAGNNHTLALCSDGTAAAWGDNLYGQLGNGSHAFSLVPVAVNTEGALANRTVVAVAAGSSHNLALCSDGMVVAWGGSTFGQLGADGASSPVPVLVDTSGALSGRTVVAIAAGNIHSLALCSDGTVAAWGANSSGQLGDNSRVSRPRPITVNTFGVLVGKTVVGLVAGPQFSLAICSDGTLAAWGANSNGQLGDSSTVARTVPVAVSPFTGGEKYTAAFSGSGGHSFGLIASPSPLTVNGVKVTTVTKTGATLSGIVNPNGSPATAYFEYGLDASYGSSASAPLSPNDGIGAQNVTATLTGLPPGTTYHYRLTVTNGAGIISTADGTFATSIDVAANFHSASDIPVTAPAFSAEGGATFSATLSFAPETGTNLMVVKNTGLGFIRGEFSNLTQGQVVTLTFNGVNYRFIANYYGGTGNDLVLQWALTRPVRWGKGVDGASPLVPVELLSTGALVGKTVISVAPGEYHSLALCSDGTVVAWGSNSYGQLGNNTKVGSLAPVLVDMNGVLAGKSVAAVAVSKNHSLAVCSDGTVAAWGRGSEWQLGTNNKNDSSSPVAIYAGGVLAEKAVIAVAAGDQQSLALCSDGSIVGWGASRAVPELMSPTGALVGKTVGAIASSGDHTLALCSDGSIAAWGDNRSGQLGDGTTTNSATPVAVSAAGVLSGKTVTAVVVGSSHSLALCSDGAVAAWGANGVGQLGNNGTVNSAVPVAVDNTGVLSGKAVVGVAVGSGHNLALCSDGSIAAWGYNYGALGNNSYISSNVPVAVNTSSFGNGERFVAAFAGFTASTSLALVASSLDPVAANLPTTNVSKTGVTLNGVVDPNGNASIAHFEYGLDATYGSTAPVSLSPHDGIGAQAVSATLSSLVPGTVYHYRLTVSNAIGTSNTTDGTFVTVIDVVANYQSASDIPVTASSVLAEGGTFSATLNFAPTIGTNLTVVKNTGLGFIKGTLSNLAQGQLVTLSYGGIDYRFVANYYGGTGNDLVLHWAGSRPVAWGFNGSGQLGDSSATNRFSPINVLATDSLIGKTVVSAAAGQSHSLALCSDGTVVAWGLNSNGQLGNASTTNSLTPINVNATGVLAGRVVVAVAAGSSHSLALCSDGTVAAWGANFYGQLGTGSTFSSLGPVAVNAAGVLAGKMVVAIAAGDSHSLALCSDGTVAAWGLNSSGRLGNSIGLSSSVPVAVNAAGVLAGKTVIAVAAGGAHSLALCSDGTVAAWGSNSYGQLGDNSIGNRTSPVVVSTSGILAGKTVAAVAAGSDHSLALCSDGTVAAWGSNSYGQLGSNSFVRSMIPVAVSTEGVLSGKVVTAVAAGGNHSLVLCSDATLVAWGKNVSGELGNDIPFRSWGPLAVSDSPLAGGEKYAAVFSGATASHNFGIIVSPPAPAVTTDAVTDLVSGSVTLNGTVNAADGNASVFFDYGLDTTYGSTVTGLPTSVSGSTATAVSATLLNLPPNTTFHYRGRATNAGGTTNGADSTFTTPPDTTGPIGGTMTLSPVSAVEAGATLTVGFSNWMDWSMPLTYSVLIDNVVVSEEGASASREIIGPATAGTHTLKGRIYDALGNFTEVTQSFTVIATQEDWRTYYFGSPENTGDAADLADPDGDGADNRFEYIAGLVPTDALSRFGVRVEWVTGQPDQKRIIFGPLVPGRTYTVKYKASLSDEAWAPLTDFDTSDNGAERTITDLSGEGGPRFYRVEITRP